MEHSSEVPYEVVNETDSLSMIKLKIPDIGELPKVSIVTPMYNRYHFIKLMIRNFKKIYYERHL